jgi:hypothetical protein
MMNIRSYVCEILRKCRWQIQSLFEIRFSGNNYKHFGYVNFDLKLYTQHTGRAENLYCRNETFTNSKIMMMMVDM